MGLSGAVAKTGGGGSGNTTSAAPLTMVNLGKRGRLTNSNGLLLVSDSDQVYFYWTPKVKNKLKWALILIKDKMDTPACVYYRML